MIDAVSEAYKKAKKRLFLLDYDGTLVGYKPKPPEAKPTPQVLELLEHLASDPDNTVIIVSGRDHPTLGAWLGDLPLTLVAEHGHFRKQPGCAWEVLVRGPVGWKRQARAIMGPSSKAISGTHIERKENALVWHYRTASRPAAQEAQALLRRLQPLAKTYGLWVVPGNKMIEIRSAGADKGRIGQTFVNQDDWGFILAAGDDTTDEDLFAALPDSAYTIKIGRGTTKAKNRLPSPKAFLDLLGTLGQA